MSKFFGLGIESGDIDLFSALHFSIFGSGQFRPAAGCRVH